MDKIIATEICKMNPSKMLDSDAALFKALHCNPPGWWKKLVNDPEIYIEIRKRNIIHAYYYGARIAEIDFIGQNFTAKCHKKYIYGTNCSVDGDKYESCIHLLEKELNRLKRNAKILYLKDVEGEEASEKRIQGRMRIDNDDRYVDTEFEHQYKVGDNNSFIRLDLIAVDGNELKIEELKRIGDNRLRTSDMINNPPEIIDQMERYIRFMSVNEAALCEYYKTLINIKTQLRLPVPAGYDPNMPLVLDPIPLLLIKNIYRYSKMSNARYERIKDIRNILEENNIKYYILP
ncbi:MAG: hypothetical protein K2J97_03420 [Muribaculaceae bacterium]|nr:hypothetical protein [Muribaculaceae bacterium]